MRTRLDATSWSRAALAGLLAVVLTLGAAACGGDDDDQDATAGADDPAADAGGSDDPYADGGLGSRDDGDGGAAADADVTITGLSYDDVSAAPGDELVIQNDGSAPHTFTSSEGGFDSGSIAPGESGAVTAPTEPGEYAFFCEIHPQQMRATLTVA